MSHNIKFLIWRCLMSNKTRHGEPSITFRLPPDKTEKLNKILVALNCTWGGKPSVGGLIKQILRGDIILTKVE